MTTERTVQRDADGFYRAGRPDVAIPPGETSAELLAERQMSQAALARAMGRPVQAINEIVRGKKEITAETALAFERVLDVSADFWMRLEANYRLSAARLKQRATVRRSRGTSGRGGRMAATTKRARTK